MTQKNIQLRITIFVPRVLLKGHNCTLTYFISSDVNEARTQEAEAITHEAEARTHN